MKSDLSDRPLGEFLNGRLSADEAAACRQALETPEGAAALAWEAAIRDAVRESADLAIDGKRGYAQVWARIERDRQPRRPKRAAAALAALSDWLRASPGFAVACAVIAVQAVLIAHLLPRAGGEPEYAIVRALPSQGGQYEPFVRVSFSPDATEQALRVLLNALSAEIVAGPTQLGDYYLLVPPGKAPAAAEALRGSPLVEATALVDELPGGE